MSIEMCVLASGSTGNCTVLRVPGGVLMIDCGIGPRTAAARLAGSGIGIDDIKAVCLTHLDRDHFNLNWVNSVRRAGLPIYCSGRYVRHLRQLELPDIRPFEDRAFEPWSGLALQPIALAHDAEGSHGFVVEASGLRLGYATDLGRVPTALIDRFSDLDILAIESNYDPEMQRASGRPIFLQQRITGGRGHLSNAQAFEAVCRMLDRSRIRLPGHIVLLHRSRQCNHADLVRETFLRDPRIAGRLILAEPFERTQWLTAGTGRSLGAQLQLEFA